MKQQKITASLFIQNEGKVLIVHRSENETFAPGNWELPGGHVEFGETIEDAMIRETREETGLDVGIESPYHAFTYVLGEEEKHYVEIILFAKMIDPNQKIKLNPDEHSEYKWISDANELKGLPIFYLEKKAIEEGFKVLEGSRTKI